MTGLSVGHYQYMDPFRWVGAWRCTHDRGQYARL